MIADTNIEAQCSKPNHSMNTIHTPDRYVSELKVVDGRKRICAIMYFGRTLEKITLHEMIQDRKKAFGDKWRQCETRNENGVLVTTIRKGRKRLHKSELR